MNKTLPSIDIDLGERGGFLFREPQPYIDPDSKYTITVERVEATGRDVSPAGNETFRFFNVQVSSEDNKEIREEDVRSSLINGFVMVYESDIESDRARQYSKDKKFFNT